MNRLPRARHLLLGTPESDHDVAQSEALFLSIGDGAIATDENGNIERINNTALDILGYKEAEVLGKWFPKLIPARDEDGIPIDLIDRPVSQAMLTGVPVSSRAEYLNKKGKPVPVFMTVAPILLHGKPVGAIEVFRDITHDQEVDRMKSEFISIASHQLRTPLTAIKTYSHMLASGYKGNLSPQQQEFMDIILSSIDRMNELINTLLDISRIEEGMLTLANQLTPLDDLARELITELHSIAEAKDLHLKLTTSGSGFTVMTDPMLYKELLSNLISNAIKYTPAGGKIYIELHAKPKEAIINVRDNGYGIPAAQQQRVFTKFFRADNVVTKDTSGTGLGLYLVRRIADNLGGRVWFESQEGKGSSFFVSLPKN